MLDENIKLSRFEYDLLKLLYRVGYRYIARDSYEDLECSLWFYKIKPIKYSCFWDCEFDKTHFNNSISLFFEFVKWNDKEPTKIKDLIKHYELQERN